MCVCVCVCVFVFNRCVFSFFFFQGFPLFFFFLIAQLTPQPKTPQLHTQTKKKGGADIRACSLDRVAKEARVCTRNNRRALLFKVTRTLKRK